MSWNRKVHNILASTSFSGTSGEMTMLCFFVFLSEDFCSLLSVHLNLLLVVALHLIALLKSSVMVGWVFVRVVTVVWDLRRQKPVIRYHATTVWLMCCEVGNNVVVNSLDSIDLCFMGSCLS